jgi:hypothetical protein
VAVYDFKGKDQPYIACSQIYTRRARTKLFFQFLWQIALASILCCERATSLQKSIERISCDLVVEFWGPNKYDLGCCALNKISCLYGTIHAHHA